MVRNSFRVRQRLAVRRSGIHGRGVFAREPIPAGTRLIEYTGERITQEEGDRRYPWDDAVPYHTLLFTVEDDLLVDGGVRGNLSRWINHSCDPNCTSVIEDRRIYIESIRVTTNISGDFRADVVLAGSGLSDHEKLERNQLTFTVTDSSGRVVLELAGTAKPAEIFSRKTLCVLCALGGSRL